MSAATIPVIGIIGGIGSGKTAVANALSNEMSVSVLDADQAGHAVLKQSITKSALRQVFGQQIFDQNGEVRRSQLAQLVFGNGEDHRKARQQLDQITHPKIHEFLKGQLSQIMDQQSCDLVVLDAALLLEAGWSESCDAIVYLDVPENVRLQRVLQRGWTEEQFRHREASQLSLEEKSAQADVTIKNDGEILNAGRQLADWIRTNLFLVSSSSMK